jgi:hypothetical protein
VLLLRHGFLMWPSFVKSGITDIAETFWILTRFIGLNYILFTDYYVDPMRWEVKLLI